MSNKVKYRSPETNLIDMVKFRSLFRPVAMAQLLSVLGEAREHDHNDAALLPHHLPEVGRRVRHGAGGGDVRGVAGVVVRLGKNVICITVTMEGTKVHRWR